MLAADLPLLRHACDDWLMVLDPDSGCLKVSMDLFSRGRASSKKVGLNHALETGDIAFIPLPAIVASALEERADEALMARTLGELLGFDPPNRLRVLTATRTGIAATVARFRNGLAPLAIENGISRYHAAILLSNPVLTPTGKFYYARIQREEISLAATTLYGVLDWGNPVVVEPGLAIGSRRVVGQA